jgi:hypothetical protein
MATYKRKLFINCTPDEGHIGARNILKQSNCILCRIQLASYLHTQFDFT